MKRISYLLVLSLMLLIVAPANAMVDVQCFSQEFIRGTGEPITETHSFPGSGLATIMIFNGAQNDTETGEAVSSSIITVNGNDVFGTSDFSQKVTYLEKQISLNGEPNTISVQLRGKPGGGIRILITHVIEADAAAYVGPEGAAFTIENLSSLLNGVGIEIAQGACETGTLMTIAEEDQPPAKPLPEGVVPDGPCISFESSDNNFQAPVYIKIPFAGERLENELRLVYTYNEAKAEWELVTPLPTDDPSIFFAKVEHFSTYQKAKAFISDYYKSTGFNMKVDTLRYDQNPKIPCVVDPTNKGICTGIGLVSTEYFNNSVDSTNENLMCYWDREASAAAACDAFGVYLHRSGYDVWDFFGSMARILFGRAYPSLGDRDYSYIVDAVKANIENNKVTPIFVSLERENPDVPGETEWVAHSLVAYGWVKTGFFSGELMVYDVNHNDQLKVVKYFQEKLFTLMEYGPWENFFLDPLVDELDIAAVINEHLRSDEDRDSVGDPCDTCPNTPEDEESDEYGCSISQRVPNVANFDIQPRNITEGNSITASYTVADNNGLTRVELWSAPYLYEFCNETVKSGCTWIEVKRQEISGTSPPPGEFTDTPPVGTWWYGLHVIDTDGNCATQNNQDCTAGELNGGVQVTVSAVPVALAPPTGIIATYEPENNWVRITWNVVPDATSYKLYWGNESGVTVDSEPGGNTSGTVFTHTGVVPGYTYYYRITSIDADGNESDLSEQVSAYVPFGSATGLLPDTGQTTCYGDVGIITCPSPGERFYGQDANYSINPKSYTKLGDSGADLPDSATTWAMVRDNVTGLIWEVKSNKDGVKDYSNPNDADNTYSWYDSNPETNGGYPGTPGNGTDTEDFIAALNAANFSGYNDWRLPTIKELSLLMHADKPYPGPTIHTAFFKNTLSSYYWSSTTNTAGYSPGGAWHVQFIDGSVYAYNKSYSYYVRAVRGGQ